jgi:serine/threonine-protein kinase
LSHYRIVSKIGAGGMGEVYLAQDTKLDRKVAIKFLHDEFSKDTDKLNRFIREAKAASALNHPNILTVHEIGEVGRSPTVKEGVHYIVTEFIDGKTLREHLSDKEALSLNTILKIGVQVAEALSAAHQAGIIHRDIKPENIMLRKDGYAKVLDFGLAKLSEPVAPASTCSEDDTRAFVKTNPGMVMGTVSYMSPEQARGKETDARTDIWSLGVVLYEMLSGKVPFTGETINHTIVSILEKEPLPLENVPAELQRIVRKAMTKDVEMRYQSARDLLIDLKNLRRDLDIQGELERSVVPNRSSESESANENQTQVYAGGAVAATRSGQSASTRDVQHSSSSLEYAVTQAKRHKLAATIVGLFLVGVISTIGYFTFVSRGGSTKQISSIAVMPFVNASGNADLEYLSDGMTETLISGLTQLTNLNVKARSSVFRYKGKETDTKNIGKELGVQAILNGRVDQRGDQLTLNLELVDVATENAIWSQQYSRKQSDLVSLQSEIARDVSSKLKSKLSGADVAKVEKTYTADPGAYQLYLKGRFLWNKRTGESLKQAVEFFDQAIRKDPNYALAYSGLAESYVLFPNYSVTTPLDCMPKAKAAALKAIELDDSLAEAHTALGIYLSAFSWNQPAAEKEFRRAIELNPTYPTAHQQFANYCLLSMGRFDEALAEARRAEELDPLSPVISADVAWPLYFARRYDEAITQLKGSLILDPNFSVTRRYLGTIYHTRGMYNEALAEYRKSPSLSGDPYLRAMVARSLAKTGKRAEAVRILAEIESESSHRYVPSNAIALAFAELGEKDKAFFWLEKDVAERASRAAQYATNPIWDDLRDDPRFGALVRKVEQSKLD